MCDVFKYLISVQKVVIQFPRTPYVGGDCILGRCPAIGEFLRVASAEAVEGGRGAPLPPPVAGRPGSTVKGKVCGWPEAALSQGPGEVRRGWGHLCKLLCFALL